MPNKPDNDDPLKPIEPSAPIELSAQDARAGSGGSRVVTVLAPRASDGD